MPSVTALRRWLVFVALARLLAVYLGFLNYKRFQTNLFDKQPEQVTPLYGRTFGTWTAMSCMLCLLCAKDPTNQALYRATFFSFVLALLHIGSELLFYETTSFVNAIQPMAFAGISVVWMGAGWNYYTTSADTEHSEEITSEPKKVE